MAVNQDTLYVKGDRNVEVTKREVTLGDLVSMECSNRVILPHLKTMKVLNCLLYTSRLFLRTQQSVRRMEAEGLPHPSFFEFLFGMAMAGFEEAGVEYVILETGPVSYTHLDVYKRQVNIQLTIS